MFDQPAPMPNIVRAAESRDFSAVSSFLSSLAISHRHLDWKPPIEWLGSSPFLIAEVKDQILGMLICPLLHNGFTWIRYFGTHDWRNPERIWQLLWDQALPLLRDQNVKLVATLSLHDWFDNLLLKTNFTFHQHIINLEWTDQEILPRKMPEGIDIREMTQSDLATVHEIDRQAFEDIWQYSEDELSLAFGQSAYCTVAVFEEKIIGFQMSTLTGLSCHLARLAVATQFRGHNIGYNLVTHLLAQMDARGIWRVTVNTQSTNQASQALYHRLGFRDAEGDIPVYITIL